MSVFPVRRPAPAFDSSQFRQALSQFATGVTIVTVCDPDGAPVGVTINSFSSVSLEPPLVLWSLAHSAGSMAAFVASEGFVINVLSGHQRYAEGDHVIFVGEVERCHAQPHRTLGFHRGRFIAI